MEFSSMALSSNDQSEFEQIAAQLGSESGYKSLSTGELPRAIPDALRSKLTGAVMMWERSTDGSVYLVVNAVRLDAGDYALDQQPFGVAVNSSGTDTSGVFIQHGDWPGRTVPLSTTHGNLLASTSLGYYFPFGDDPPSSSGPLTELAKTSHEGAFHRMMQHFVESSSTASS
jgi:hypothetical protein